MADIRAFVRKLLGVSAYEEKRPGAGPPDRAVEQLRENLGGNITPLPQTQTRWYLADLENAEHAADVGDLSQAARLYRSMLTDGTLMGVLSTRTGGLVRLPKRFYGNPEMVGDIEPRNGSRSVFEEMFPSSELAALDADGIVLGVGVAELVPVEGRDYPVMVRLDPEFLRYRWNEGRWYFMSIAGPIPIVPGDGRWILHVPGGRQSPWQRATWKCLSRAYINKSHALLHRSNYSAKLANPARVGVAPLGASEGQKLGFLRSIMAWGINAVFDLPVGWDIKLLESNGRGFAVFQEEIATSDNEMTIALAGQVVTTTGGVGFANSDVFKSIKADLIKADGEGLAYTINTQGIPYYIAIKYGVDKLDIRPIVEWDVEPAKDRNAEAMSLVTIANAVKGLNEVLQQYGRQVDIIEIANRFGIPIDGDADGDGTPDVDVPVTIVEAPEADEAPPLTQRSAA